LQAKSTTSIHIACQGKQGIQYDITNGTLIHGPSIQVIKLEQSLTGKTNKFRGKPCEFSKTQASKILLVTIEKPQLGTQAHMRETLSQEQTGDGYLISKINNFPVMQTQSGQNQTTIRMKKLQGCG